MLVTLEMMDLIVTVTKFTIVDIPRPVLLISYSCLTLALFCWKFATTASISKNPKVIALIVARFTAVNILLGDLLDSLFLIHLPFLPLLLLNTGTHLYTMN